jgi:hypothetical protein
MMLKMTAGEIRQKFSELKTTLEQTKSTRSNNDASLSRTGHQTSQRTHVWERKKMCSKPDFKNGCASKVHQQFNVSDKT